MSADIFTGIDKVINKVISLDNESTLALSKFQGKHINIDLKNTQSVFCIKIVDAGVHISNNCTSAADVTIRATPMELINYLIIMNQEDTILTGKLQISGDITLAQNLQLIIKGMDIDWVEKLSHLIGDTMAHKAGRVAEGSAEFLKKTHEIIKTNISEYLLYETEMLADNEEINEFNQSVDNLRDDTERLKIRINKIKQKTK